MIQCLFEYIEHIYSFARASHASGMGEKNAEVMSIMVLHGDVTEPARLSVCEARTVVFWPKNNEHILKASQG